MPIATGRSPFASSPVSASSPQPGPASLQTSAEPGLRRVVAAADASTPGDAAPDHRGQGDGSGQVPADQRQRRDEEVHGLRMRVDRRTVRPGPAPRPGAPG